MPVGDQTGPRGDGPMTGRGLGYPVTGKPGYKVAGAGRYAPTGVSRRRKRKVRSTASAVAAYQKRARQLKIPGV